MSFSAAFIVLAVGIVLGYRLHDPVNRLRAWLRRRRFKPELLRPWQPTDEPGEGG